MLLHDHLGIALANLVSTTAGMIFSFVVNGLFTFRADKLTLRHAVLFLVTNALVMWIIQPLLIHGWLWLLEHGPDVALGPMSAGDVRIAVAKLAAIACCLVINFFAYRYVVWPVERRAEDAPV